MLAFSRRAAAGAGACSGGFSGIDPEFAKRLKAVLIQPDGQKIVEELVTSGLITSHDLVNIGYRKAQLASFTKGRRSSSDTQGGRRARQIVG
jgi:hypothetical protein